MHCGKIPALSDASVVYSLSPGIRVECVDLMHPGCRKRSVPPQHDDSVPREVDPLTRVVGSDKLDTLHLQKSSVPTFTAASARLNSQAAANSLSAMWPQAGPDVKASTFISPKSCLDAQKMLRTRRVAVPRGRMKRRQAICRTVN